MSTSSGSFLQLRANSRGLSTAAPSRSRSPSPSLLPCVVAQSRGSRVKAVAAGRRQSSVLLEKRILGSRLRPSLERVHLWQSDGPGKSPKLRVVVRSALSGVPEKPLGLYDPAFDKDSCGVGFVAELSGDCSRKTVCFPVLSRAWLCMIIIIF